MFKSFKQVTQEVTDQLMKLVKEGTLPWKKGWVSIIAGYISLAINPTTKEHYSLGGVYNSLIYRIAEMQYGSRVFCNEDMRKRHGLIPKNGMKPFEVYHPIFRDEERIDDDGKKTIVKVMIGFSTKPMWCCGQFSNWNEKRKTILKPELVKRFMWKPNASAEAFGEAVKTALGFSLQHGEENNPCFVVGEEEVKLPNRDQFISDGEYYVALFHEIGHASRKVMGGKGSYDFEEIVVESSAAILCSLFGIDFDVPNAAAYVAHWSKAMGKCAEDGTLVKAFAEAGNLAKFMLQKGGQKVE